MAEAHVYLQPGANVEATDTFASWVETTNMLVYDMGTKVVTTAPYSQPNTSVGGYTTGNSHIEGRFSANTLIAETALRGGTVSTPANLIVSSNTIFNESALVQVGANTNLLNIDANNAVISSNVTFDGGATKVIRIDVANTTVNTGVLFVNSNTHWTGAVANVHTTMLDIKANTWIDSTTIYLNASEIAINGEAPSGTMLVNTDTTFGANTLFNGALLNVTGANTTIGDSGADKLNAVAEAIFSANATFNGALVNITSTNTTIGNAATDRLNVNSISDFNANVNIDGILTQTANVVFSGALVNITSTNTTIGDAATDRLNVNAVSDFNANVNVDGIFTVANNATISNTLTVNTQANTASLMVRDLTATRVPYIGTAGEIIDSANLVFSGTQLSLTGTMAVTGNETVSGTLGVTGAATFANTIAVTGAATFSNNAVFGDNRYIIMGASEDLMIYHDGSHSYISDLGTGNLKLDASQLDIQTSNSTATETMATFVRDGAVTLYYDNGAKFATTSTGASVTGVLAVSGNETVGGTLGVTGATTLSSTLGVSGTTTAAAINASGLVNITNTTDATSTTAAAIKTAGGLAVAKKVYIGDQTFASANVTISGAGNYITTPGANVISNMQVGGTATIVNLVVTGATTLNTESQLSLNNAVTAHSTVTDDLTLTNATIIGNINPDANVTYDIGGSTSTWRTLYANNVVANVAWASVTDKPDPVVTVTLTGDVAGSSSATLTDLTSGTVTISTTVQPNSVALGTDTTGNYVGTLAAGTPSTQSGTSGLTISATAGEGTSATIAHADTSSVSNLSVDNSNGTVIQDLALTFDTFGHVTAATYASVNLDTRFSQNTFSTIAVSGQSNVVADTITDTLTLVGAGITAITTNATSDTITITTTEVDTLASVTSRGNTTTNSITVNDLNANNVVISGNLTVSGTTTYVNTTNLQVGDNIITLNADYAGSTPSENAGIEVERGTLANTSLLWNETTDRWTFTNDGTNYYNIPISTEYDKYTSWTIKDGDTTTYTITSGDTLQIANGSYITSNFTADDVLTISHNSTTRTNTTSSATPGFSGTFTAVDSITTNTEGHVTGVNTKTVTMPPVTNLGYTSATTQGTVTSSTGTNAVIPAANSTVAGLITTGTQTIAGTKTFSSTISGSITGNAATATYANDAGGLRASSGGAFIIDGIAQTVPVNYLQVRAANTGQDVLMTTAGSDTNVDLLIQTKGTGSITLDTGTGAGVIDLKPGSSNLRIWDDTSTQYYQIATGDLTANRTLTLPDANVTLVSGTMVPTTGTGASGTWGISISGNAATVTNGVYTTGNQTIAGLKTFSANATFNGSMTELNGSVQVSDELTVYGPLVVTDTAQFGNTDITGTLGASGNITTDGTVTASKLRLTATDDANTSTTSVAFQIGSTSGTNLIIDNNEIMARNNGVNTTLLLNGPGGNVTIGNASNTSVITLRAADVTATGDLTVTGNITAASDARLKENVVTVDSALDKVTAMRGVYFNKIGELDRKVGVIAQEVEKVLPEVISTDAEGIKSVAYANIVGLLIEAIKDLKAEIDELKSNK